VIRVLIADEIARIVGDLEKLSYRVVRPSDVVATLAGPGGTKIGLANAAQSPGLHTFTWNGNDGGTLAPEGEWTFTVTATDDRNVETTAQRTFSLDDTLSSLSVTGGSRGRPTATFRLTRAAGVLVQIERRNGVAVAPLLSGPRAAGPQRVTWRGRIGRHPAHRGRYRVVVEATSPVGTSSLMALFSFRPHKHH